MIQHISPCIPRLIKSTPLTAPIFWLQARITPARLNPLCPIWAPQKGSADGKLTITFLQDVPLPVYVEYSTAHDTTNLTGVADTVTFWNKAILTPYINGTKLGVITKNRLLGQVGHLHRRKIRAKRYRNQTSAASCASQWGLYHDRQQRHGFSGEPDHHGGYLAQRREL